MKTPTAVAALVAVLVVPCVSQTRVPADLQTAMKQRADALARADAATWGRLTADKFVVVNGSGIVQTKAERIAQLRAGQPNGPSSAEHETVQMYGTTALQRFQSVRNGIWVTFVWSKARNGWRVAFAQVTPIFPDSAEVRHAIDQDNAQFVDAFKRGDAAGLASHYGDGAVMMLANGPAVEGTAAIKQGFTDFLSNVSVPNFQLTTHDIILEPGYAIERGTYEMTIHPKSGTAADIVDRGKYLTVRERQPDGSWKIIRDISNSDIPAQR
jgi:uncharacterized protein (TIGR02246 family)